MLKALEGSDLYLLAVLLAATGMRRGEALGLAWRHFDLENGTVQIERSVEQTKAAGVRIKPAPKNESSRRTIPLLSDGLVALLRAERAAQAERHLACGIRMTPKVLVFHPGLRQGSGGLTLADLETRPFAPDWISLKFLRKAKTWASRSGFTRCATHTRHSSSPPASRRRAWRSGSAIAPCARTLDTYAHVVAEADDKAAKAGVAIMRDVLA